MRVTKKVVILINVFGGKRIYCKIFDSQTGFQTFLVTLFLCFRFM
jgi:hypothetical protein